MPYIVRDLGNLTPTSSSALFTNGIGLLDDAANLSIVLASSANANTSVATIQVSQFDPSITFPTPGVSQSSGWFSLSTSIATITSSGSHVAINNVAFRGIRLSITTSNAGEIIGRVMKQITV